MQVERTKKMHTEKTSSELTASISAKDASRQTLIMEQKATIDALSNQVAAHRDQVGGLQKRVLQLEKMLAEQSKGTFSRKVLQIANLATYRA